VEGDHVAYRYEIGKVLGKGTFGVVVECFDYKRNEKVAMKIIKNKKRFFQQGTVEIKVLQQLRENDLGGKYNVLKIKNYFLFRKHICISCELLSINLLELLQQNNFEGLSLTLIHRFAVQLLVCLQYIANEKIIHCDLKPENILLKDTEKAMINVIDFGSSCFESEKVYYYIQSRFYRAPEVILGISYTTAIDMWSLGCILAELFTGKPLFCGDSEHFQLICIMEVLGVPPKSLLSRSSKREMFFDQSGAPKIVVNKKGVKKHPASRSLEEVLQTTCENFVDFIRKCLVWEPKERMKPLQGLDHPWITDGLKRKGGTEDRL
jgi:dual specificity tyrosine-phosphorylation-regulated kinase 2/3/4